MHAPSHSAATSRRRLAPTFPMREGDLLRIDHRDALQVRVQSGTVWLTQAGDRQDYYLDGGRALRLERRGATVVQALGNALVSVSWHEGDKPERITLSRHGRPLRVIPGTSVRGMSEVIAGFGARLKRLVPAGLFARTLSGSAS